MAKVTLIQGEAKLLPFRIKSRVTGQLEDLSGARFLLWVKRDLDDDYPMLMKQPTDFDTSTAGQGYITVFLTDKDTYLDPFIYSAELRITLAGAPVPVEKLPFDLEILPAVTPTDFGAVPTGIVSLEAVGAPAVVIT